MKSPAFREPPRFGADGSTSTVLESFEEVYKRLLLEKGVEFFKAEGEHRFSVRIKTGQFSGEEIDVIALHLESLDDDLLHKVPWNITYEQ